MRRGATPRMAECLKAIRKLTVDGVPPSYEQLRIALGLASKSGIHRLVGQLRERGLIEHERGAGRSIALIEEDLLPERLARLTSEQLRIGAAHIAGILAHREGDQPTGAAFQRIADRITHQPREVQPPKAEL